jgi:hypothetical protein
MWQEFVTLWSCYRDITKYAKHTTTSGRQLAAEFRGYIPRNTKQQKQKKLYRTENAYCTLCREPRHKPTHRLFQGRLCADYLPGSDAMPQLSIKRTNTTSIGSKHFTRTTCNPEEYRHMKNPSTNFSNGKHT